MTARRQLLNERLRDTEKLDRTPVHVPGAEERPLTLREEMRRFVREELSKAATEEGAGSFEEEDDFSEDDGEIDITSQYTVQEMQDFDDVPADTLEGAPTAEDINHSKSVSAEPPLGDGVAEAEGETPAPSPVNNQSPVTAT